MLNWRAARRPRLIRHIVWAGAALLLCVWLLGCERAPRWNVLLVTLDTTRADHLGCYGSDKVMTPNFDELAAEGVRYARAYSAIPVTSPSHATILTGKYPLAHGVRDNGTFVLPEQQLTLAEILRERGYATAAAIASFPLLARFGHDQGFDLYDDQLAKPWQGLGQAAARQIYFDERRAAFVNEAILPWLEQRGAEPFFAWVHYFDPHQPYDPPPPYDQLYAQYPYGGEIAYTDEAFGQLVAKLKELGQWDRTIVVLTADHGEGLGEHGEITHALQLYDTTLHVPLIVRHPQGPRAKVVDRQVGTVDLLPTLLDFLAMEPPPDLQGQSLAQDLEGQGSQAPSSLPLYAETLVPRLVHGWGELRSIRAEDDYKLIFGPRPELYDLGEDPRELRDLYAAEDERRDRLERRLARFLKEEAAQEDLQAAVDVDEETRRRLEALGYISGSGDAPETIREELRRDGTPPQDRIRDVSLWSQVRQHLHDGRVLSAREGALELLRREPDSPVYMEMLVASDLQLGRLEEGERNLQKLLDLRPGGEADAGLLRHLGSLWATQGQMDRAVNLVLDAERMAASAEGQYLLARLYQARGEAERRLEALAQALELDSTFVPARVDLAVHHAQAGDRQPAGESFRQALKDDPYFPRAFYNYGLFLAEGGELEAALAPIQRALELHPQYWAAHLTWVELNLALGRRDAAETSFRILQERVPHTPPAQLALERWSHAPGSREGAEGGGA